MNSLRLLRNNISPLIRHDLNIIKTYSLPHNFNCGVVSSLHTSSKFLKIKWELDSPQNSQGFGEITSFKFKRPEIKYAKPVDWLPFPWHRRVRYNVYDQSGDTIRTITADPSLPKPDFELSDELKNADEEVKKYFSLQTANTSEIKEVCKRQLLQRIQRHPNDLTSPEVIIALKTLQIRGLLQHREKLSKWEARYSRVILPIMIQKRNKLLNKLRALDTDRFLWLLEELKLYYKQNPVHPESHKYCKKWDLRQLTKEYCQKVIADKKAAYHEELKKQQADFLEEKKQILAFIEEEEKALNVRQ